MLIRRLEEKDDATVANIIRTCLIEYGGDHRSDTAWGDPYLDHFSTVYVHDNNAYFVAENDEKEVVAGCGIGPIGDDKAYSELQKMYCLKEYRGTGISEKLLERCLSFAKSFGYRFCYLETLDNMERAKRFYEKHGFKKTLETIGETGHTGCNSHYILDLTHVEE